jgi:tetratricopeptide (TPR) repeat protein
MARSTRAKRRLTLLAILTGSVAAAGLGSYAGVKWYRGRQVEAARVEGMAKFEAGDYSGALDKLSLYVAKNQKDVDAILKLAKCRFMVFAPNRRNYVDAAYFYRAASELKPGSVEALTGLLESYEALGYGPELLEVADELLRLDPKHIKALQVRIRVAGGRGAWPEALAECKKLIEIEPNNYQWRVLALEGLRRSGASLDALRAQLTEWMQAGEPDGRYRLLLAAYASDEGDRTSARREVTEAATRGVPDSNMLSALVELATTLELPDVVEKAIAKARADGVPEVDIIDMQIERHWLAGRFDDAKAAIASFPPDNASFSAKLLRWRILIAEGERDAVASDAAIAELRPIYQADAERAEAGILWLDAVQASRAAEGDGPFRPSVAMGLLQRAISLNRDDVMLQLRAGDVSLRAGETDEAVRYYTSAFEGARRRWVTAGVRTVSAMLGVGRSEQAFHLAREISRRFPDAPSGYFVLAQACDALAREGRTPSSIDPSLPRDTKASFILQTLYDGLGKNPVFLPPLIGTLVQDGDIDEASRLAGIAIADPKTTSEALLQIAVMMADRRFGDTPLRALETATGRAGPALEVTIARARVQIARGEYGPAKHALQEAIGELTDPAQRLRRAELRRLYAEAAIAAGDGEINGMLADVLKDGGDDIDSISFVLGQNATWEDEPLVNAAIAKLGELIGESSPRTVLTNAARVLRFRRTVPQDVAKAIQTVDAVLAANADSTAALVTLGRLFASSQPPNLTKAIEYFERAVRLQPGRRDLYPELIAHMQAQGDFAGASSYLQQYMRSAEGDPSESRLAAGLMIQQGQYLSAIPALERVAMQTGSEADLVALADAERRAGRVDAAETAYKKALEGADRSALSAMAYTEFLARNGRLDDARRMIEDDSKRSKPALTPANRAYVLARMELDYGDPARAAVAVAQALTLAPNSAGVALLAARDKLAAGDPKAALEYARKGLTLEPENQHLLAFVASLMMADPSSRADSAQTLDLLKAKNPAVGELLAIVKSCAAPDGSISPGPAELAALLELTSKYPSEPAVWTVAIELHAAAGKNDEAIRVARRGMARLPTEPGPAEYAARLLLQDRRPEEAREAARAWRGISADSPVEPDLLLARIALIDGKPAQAVATLLPYEARLKAEALKAPESLGIYAAALLFDGKAESAVAVLKDGLTEESSVPNRERKLLTEWLRAIRTAATPNAFDALQRSEPIVAIDDTGRVALATEYVALARRKNANKAIERAKEHLDRISEAAKSAPIVQLLGADLASIAGDTSAASATYQAAWESIPETIREQLLRWAGLDAATREQIAGARSMALFAANNEASMLAHGGTELDRALTLIERALAMAPDDPAVLETKAEVLVARKEYDEARRLLQQLIGKSAGNVSLRITLAKLELGAGRVEEARRQTDTAAAAIGEDPFADRVLVEQLADLQQAVGSATKTSTASGERSRRES